MDANMLQAAMAGGTAALIFAGLLIGLTNPSYWLLQEEGGDEYDPYHGMDKVPMDDPMRSPDWCHAHGEGCGSGEK